MNRRLARIAARTAIVGVLLILLGAFAFQAAVRWWPYPGELAGLPPPATLLLDRDGRALWASTSPEGGWRLPLPAEEMNPLLAQAVVAIEDHRFASHRGVDWIAVAAATLQDARRGRVVRGASTITMQLQRLRDPRPRTFATKLIEAVRAAQIERRAGKAEILREYLERAPFGANVVGVGAASWRWFGRPCRSLSLAQCALLAGLPQSPSRLRPDLHPEAARRRRDLVLAAMRDTGRISPGDCAAALAEPVDAAWRELPQQGDDLGLAGLATGSEIPRDRGAVATTLDARMQAIAARQARRRLGELAAAGVDAVAVVALDNRDGAYRVLAAAGGPGFVDLTRVRRSPGSLLKPFIYAGAFADDLLTPGTLVDDTPGAWRGYAPLDFDHRYRGELTAADALAASRNLPAMRVLERLGPARAGAILEACGLRGAMAAASRAGLSLAIGGIEASPREIAEAYATLAALGRHHEVHLLAVPATGIDASALPERACLQALACLDVAERTAAACPEVAAARVAWKTGTSSGHRDAWCAAASPALTVVAWCGTLSGKGSPALVGVEAAAPLALGLLEELDHPRGGWRTPPPSDASAGCPSALSPPLVIVSPAPDLRLVPDPDAPRAAVRLPLAAHGGGGGRRWWFADGAAMGSSLGDQPLWLDLARGAHALQVVDAQGGGASVRVLVE